MLCIISEALAPDVYAYVFAPRGAKKNAQDWAFREGVQRNIQITVSEDEQRRRQGKQRSGAHSAHDVRTITMDDIRNQYRNFLEWWNSLPENTSTPFAFASASRRSSMGSRSNQSYQSVNTEGRSHKDHRQDRDNSRSRRSDTALYRGGGGLPPSPPPPPPPSGGGDPSDDGHSGDESKKGSNKSEHTPAPLNALRASLALRKEKNEARNNGTMAYLKSPQPSTYGAMPRTQFAPYSAYTQATQPSSMTAAYAHNSSMRAPPVAATGITGFNSMPVAYPTTGYNAYTRGNLAQIAQLINDQVDLPTTAPPLKGVKIGLPKAYKREDNVQRFFAHLADFLAYCRVSRIVGPNTEQDRIMLYGRALDS
jgi:hypothetical protein